MKLSTHLVEKPWGVTTLPDYLGPSDGRRIGELWFDAVDAALLVKYIFTSEKLSVQVHPDNAAARQSGLPHGKSEAWYIVSADEGATLGIGTREPLSGEALASAARDGSIEALMHWYPVKPGDYFFIPAGTVHAIGPGVGLIEVQQNLDCTYRLYDYGRPRELHLAEGVAVAEARPHSPANRVHVDPDVSMALPTDGNFASWYCTGGVPDDASASDGPYFCIPLSDGISENGSPARRGDCLLLDDLSALECSQECRMLLAMPRG